MAWNFHKNIFEKQGSFYPGDTKQNEKIKQTFVESYSSKPDSQKIDADWKVITACMKDTQTQKEFDQAIDAAEKVGVTGTPAIFINGRHLPRAQQLQILNRVYEEAKKQMAP